MKIFVELKNALSYGVASSTAGDPVLFECKAINIDCFNVNFHRWRHYEEIS